MRNACSAFFGVGKLPLGLAPGPDRWWNPIYVLSRAGKGLRIGLRRTGKGLTSGGEAITKALPPVVGVPAGHLTQAVGGLAGMTCGDVRKGGKQFSHQMLASAGLLEAFTERWVPGPTGGHLPKSLAEQATDIPFPANAHVNGMHAWHAGTNTSLAQQLGPLALPEILLGGVYHETPLDWGSFWAEQRWQGTVNHALDSATDIVANLLGVTVGLLVPSALGPHAGVWIGHYIPGPGEPDPAFGGGGAYTGNPFGDWGNWPHGRYLPRKRRTRSASP